MYIQEIFASCFKGRDTIQHKLGKINVIIGRNARGKTAILQLIRVLLFGYDPILGARKLGALMSGRNPAGSLGFSNGFALNRRWTRTKAGGATENDPAKNPYEVPQIMLDFKTFLEKSGPQQLAFIITQSDLAALGFTREALTAEIKNIRPGTSTEETEAALTEIITEVEKVNQAQAKEGFNINVWLERVVAVLRERLKIENAEVRRLTNAIQAQITTQEHGSEDAMPARSKVVIEREMETLREELTRLESENSVRAEQRRNYDQKRQQCEQLQQLLAGPDNAPLIAELSKKLELWEAKRNQPLKAPVLAPALNAASDDKGQASYKLQQRAADAIRIEGEIADNETRECCPSCGYSGEEFRAFVRTKLEARLAEANRLKAEARLAEEKAESAFMIAREAYDKAAAEDESVQMAQNEWNRLHREMTALATKQAARDQAQAKLEAIQLGEPPDEQATKTATERIEAIKAIGKAKRQELNQSIAQAADKLTREQTKQAKEKAEARAEMTKLAVDKLAEKQTEIVNESMKSLLRVASRFCDGIIDGALAWNDELGIWRGGQWISHEVFSDMEQALAYVGLSVALSQSSPFKVVLMDRLECVDDANIEAFMSRIMALINDGTIHQFVSVDVNAKRWLQTNPDINVIEV